MKKMSKWIIEDWTGKHCYTEFTFNSFEEARGYIEEVANEEAYNTTKDTDSQEYEEIVQGINEDLYAVEVENA